MTKDLENVAEDEVCPLANMGVCEFQHYGCGPEDEHAVEYRDCFNYVKIEKIYKATDILRRKDWISNNGNIFG